MLCQLVAGKKRRTVRLLMKDDERLRQKKMAAHHISIMRRYTARRYEILHHVGPTYIDELRRIAGWALPPCSDHRCVGWWSEILSPGPGVMGWWDADIITVAQRVVLF
jgi:hypothetical protein